MGLEVAIFLTFDNVPNRAGIREDIEYKLWRILLLVHFPGGTRDNDERLGGFT
jgi:hypothetical protein